jgi:hypothetical protein
MRPNKTLESLAKGESCIHVGHGNSMTPKIKSGQPVRLEPVQWEDCEKGDMVYCKVKGNLFTHLVKGKNDKRGVLIGNNHGRINGWTKNVYGRVTEVL